MTSRKSQVASRKSQVASRKSLAKARLVLLALALPLIVCVGYAQSNQFTITTTFTGSVDWFDGQDSHHIGYVDAAGGPPGKEVEATGNPASVWARVEGDFKLIVQYVGQGQPPTGKRFILSSLAGSQWSGGSGTNTDNDGLDDPMVIQVLNGMQGGSSTGNANLPLVFDQNGKVEFHVHSSSFGVASGGTANAQAGIAVSGAVVDRYVDAQEEPAPTYHRTPYGGAVANGRDVTNGKFYADRTYHRYWLGTFLHDWQSHFTAQATGAWNLPLQNVNWSGSTGFYWINTDWANGWTESWNTVIPVTDDYVKGLFVAPERKNYSAQLTDSIGTDTGNIVVRVHAPVEKTDEVWKAQVGPPDVLLDSVPEANFAGFQNKHFASCTNKNVPVGVHFTFTCNISVSYTYGAQQTAGGSAGFEFEILKFNFSNDYTWSSSTTYQVSHSYTLDATVPKGKTMHMEARPLGTVKYPICSHWGAPGYTSDTHELDVVYGSVDWNFYLTNATPTPN